MNDTSSRRDFVRSSRMVLRSQPVSSLIAWMLIPCRCSSLSSCTSLPLNKSRNLLHAEWVPVYHIKGWGKFNRHYGDFCTGADNPASRLPERRKLSSFAPLEAAEIGLRSLI